MGWLSCLALESVCLGFANLPLVNCFNVSPAFLASAAKWAVSSLVLHGVGGCGKGCILEALVPAGSEMQREATRVSVSSSGLLLELVVLVDFNCTHQHLYALNSWHRAGLG